MKRHWGLLLVVANLVVFVGLAFVYPHLMVSPGPLVPAHATLASDCFACHVPFFGARAGRCIGCHAVADIGLRSTAGAPIAPAIARPAFHQHLTSRDCLACHSDHQGSRIGQDSRMSFSHALLAPAALATCATCHAAPTRAFHRDLGMQCAGCHGTDRWSKATFDHTRLFRLDGDHAAPCATCHVDDSRARYTCYGCHEHQPDAIRAKHLREGIPDFQNCVSCHRSADDKPQGRKGRAGRDRD